MFSQPFILPKELLEAKPPKPPARKKPSASARRTPKKPARARSR